jgi:hypothetical protein
MSEIPMDGYQLAAMLAGCGVMFFLVLSGIGVLLYLMDRSPRDR